MPFFSTSARSERTFVRTSPKYTAAVAAATQAVIFSEDAPSLEAARHRAFHDRRVSLVNERKEFFRASIAEISGVAREHHGETALTRLAEAKEYRQTPALAVERARP